MTEPFIHYPTVLDWIEHIAAFGGFAWLGWSLHGLWQRRRDRSIDVWAHDTARKFWDEIDRNRRERGL